MWPFKKRETRESSYTALLVDLAVERATGSAPATVGAIGALEAASGLLARCFSLAEVSGPANLAAAVTPQCRAMIARALVRGGECVLQIDVDPAGMVRLHPASSWDITGDVSPDSWRYRVTLGAPSGTVTRVVESAGVVHPRWSVDPSTPWRGVGPLQSAALAGKLSAEVTAALGDEASMPRGAVLPLPVDGEDDSVASLKADLKALRGKLALVESTASMAPGPAAVPKDDWVARRIGANPPQSLVSLHSAAAAEVLGATGTPVSLFVADNSQGQRESFRRYLHTSVQPAGALLAAELSEKFETEIGLSFDRLMASDLSGRARAFQSMVGAGMDPGKAAGLAGLMESDE